MPSIEVIHITPHTAALFDAYLRAEAGTEAEAEQAVAGLAEARRRFDALASTSFWLLLALCDGQPAGTAAVARLPKTDARGGFLFVDELRVLPAYRRRGVARALLARVEGLARELGLAGVRLLARPDNEAARQLYHRAGYAESAALLCEKRL
jgi:ribosomal protein S18 acetylase RimI-like enzyme